jgi:hemerythrin-like domain-containing protein
MEFKYTDPATDFTNGLGVLKTYHEDFLSRGVDLLALINSIKQQGMNEERANQCMEAFFHYSHANHLHHQDEEQGLFPLMLGHSALIDGMIERLMLDHEEIEKAWELLAKQLASPEKITDFDQLQRLAIDFEKQQREHLNREDEDFSPKVKATLSDEQLTQLGKKLAELRHLTVF